MHMLQKFTKRGKVRRMPLPWKEFVTKPWFMGRAHHDELLEREIEQGVLDPKDIVCRDYLSNWTWSDVTPCSFEDLMLMDATYMGIPPLYELKNDKSGDHFSSILSLRSAKLSHFLQEVPTFHGIKHFIPVRYEDVVLGGTAGLVLEVERITGVKAKCDPYAPQNRTAKLHDKEYVKWMNKHVDWEAEALLGYKRQSII